MVKSEKLDHPHLVCHFTTPLKMSCSSHVPKCIFWDENYGGNRLAHFMVSFIFFKKNRTKFDECQGGKRNIIHDSFYQFSRSKIV